MQSSLAKTAHYPHIAWIFELESRNGDPDHLKIINYSLCHCRAILKISSKSAHNLFSNGQILALAVSMVIQITTKI